MKDSFGFSPMKASLIAVAVFAFAATALFAYFPYIADRRGEAFVILRRSDLRMNTLATLSIEAPRKKAEEVMEASFSLLEDLDRLLSRYEKGSDIWKINEASGVSPVRVGAAAIAALNAALEAAEKTGGAFDPTVGPLTDLWRILSKKGEKKDEGIEKSEGNEGDEEWFFPSEEQIAAARERVVYRKLSIAAPFVYLSLKGAALDLGGIAKGYAADKIAEFYRAQGVRSALLALGGNLLILGTPPRGASWQLGIRNPVGDKDSVICSLAFDPAPGETMSVATSGSYERFRDVDGKRL